MSEPKTKKLWIAVSKKTNYAGNHIVTKTAEDLEGLKMWFSDEEFNFLQIEIPEE